MLYRIKHLVEITPITTPYGMPDDSKNGFLKENGEFISYNYLEGHRLQLEEAEQKVDELKKNSVDGGTLKTRLRQNYYGRW
jgi:large subunit ribosomal protein L30